MVLVDKSSTITRCPDRANRGYRPGMRAYLLAFCAIAAACGGGGGDDGSGDDDDGPTGDPLDPALEPTIDTDPSHYPANVWVTDGMVKVQPESTPGDLHWARLWAARNETESFQVHVRADDAPVQLRVTLSDLVDPISGTAIAADSHVVVSREAYLAIDQLSDANGIGGRVPDALIPAIDPYVREARNAFPVTVPVGETRSAWIDVLVPDDAPSGWYVGTVTVSDGDAMLAELPVVLAVWDVTLPSTATLASGFGLSWNGLCVQAYGGYEGCGAYPGADGNADRGVELIHVAEAELFLDHRVSLAAAVYAAPDDGDWTHFDELYAPLMLGAARTRLPGARLTHLWYTGDLGDATVLADWQAHFLERAWLDRTSAYFCDEPPNGCSFDETRARADVIRAAAPGLDTLLTTDLDEASENELLDRVDIMVAIVESMENRDRPSMRAEYDAWLASGDRKRLWWYQSCDEHESCSNGSPGPATATWPSYMVDASPMRNRVFQWLAWMYDVEGELYYATDYCWTAECGGQSDPWVSLYAFGGNGDGTLFYPGTPEKIGGTTPVPVGSVRLALIRDGMEDYELLAMSDAQAARAAAESFITNTYTFSDDPAELQAARRALGDALHAAAQ
jgi:hypothetical protein